MLKKNKPKKSNRSCIEVKCTFERKCEFALFKKIIDLLNVFIDYLWQMFNFSYELKFTS